MRRRRFDDDLAVRGLDDEVRAFLPARADRQLDLLVDHALEEARAEADVVALRHDQLERVVLDLNRLARLGQRQRDLRQVVLRDLPHLVVRERREQHDLVDAVAELRREAPFELAEHLALDLLDADVPRHGIPSSWSACRKCSEPRFDVMMTTASLR